MKSPTAHCFSLLDVFFIDENLAIRRLYGYGPDVATTGATKIADSPLALVVLSELAGAGHVVAQFVCLWLLAVLSAAETGCSCYR